MPSDETGIGDNNENNSKSARGSGYAQIIKELPIPIKLFGLIALISESILALSLPSASENLKMVIVIGMLISVFFVMIIGAIFFNEQIKIARIGVPQVIQDLTGNDWRLLHAVSNASNRIMDHYSQYLKDSSESIEQRAQRLRSQGLLIIPQNKEIRLTPAGHSWVSIVKDANA